VYAYPENFARIRYVCFESVNCGSAKSGCRNLLLTSASDNDRSSTVQRWSGSAAIVGCCQLSWQLLRQNGRILLRLEELEKLDQLEFGEPQAGGFPSPLRRSW
jgi:hypothetical protein